jgi:DNA-binding transcriptional LysR family regulator
MQINLSPTDLDTFISVAATGNFRQSARDLGISQPTVSARIRHLEDVLGVRLFHRTTRRVTITDAGERLRARVERMVLETRLLVTEFREEAQLRRGRLVIGASPSVAASFLPRAISDFRRRWPDVEVELLDDFYGQAMDRLSRGDVDLAVSPYVSTDGALQFDPLIEDRFRLAVADGHPLVGRGSVTIADIAGETLISMPPESAAWATLRRAFERAGHSYTPAFMTRYSLTMVALIRQGIGIGLVSDLVMQALDADGLHMIPVAGIDITRQLGIVSARDRDLSPAAAAFREMLLRLARE